MNLESSEVRKSFGDHWRTPMSLCASVHPTWETTSYRTFRECGTAGYPSGTGEKPQKPGVQNGRARLGPAQWQAGASLIQQTSGSPQQHCTHQTRATVALPE